MQRFEFFDQKNILNIIPIEKSISDFLRFLFCKKNHNKYKSTKRKIKFNLSLNYLANEIVQRLRFYEVTYDPF